MTSIKKAMTIRVCVLVLAALAALAATAPARAAEHASVEQMVSSAKTAADHEALAAHYDREAAAARAKAEEHRKMAEAYHRQGGAIILKLHFDEHCDALVKYYTDAAEQFAAMAKGHREMAAEAKATK